MVMMCFFFQSLVSFRKMMGMRHGTAQVKDSQPPCSLLLPATNTHTNTKFYPFLCITTLHPSIHTYIHKYIHNMYIASCIRLSLRRCMIPMSNVSKICAYMQQKRGKIYYGFTEETREEEKRDDVDDDDALAFYVNAA